MQPNPITFVGVLNACTNIAAVEEGRYAHELLFQSGCHSDVFVGNSLVDMYAECGSVEDAQTVFNKMPSQRYGDLDCHAIGTRELHARHEGTQEYFNIYKRVCNQTLLLLWGC